MNEMINYERKHILIINRELQKFIRDWKKSPYLWGNEVDIQVEIVSRLKAAIKKKLIRQLVKYKDWSKNKEFSCVSCEPLTYYKKNAQKIKTCFPDIVLCHHLKSGPPDDKTKNGWPKVNWPMLWVCEIKYENEWGGDFHKENKERDRRKLKCLLKQRNDRDIHGTEYACTLNFYRTKKIQRDKKPKMRRGHLTDWVIYAHAGDR